MANTQHPHAFAAPDRTNKLDILRRQQSSEGHPDASVSGDVILEQQQPVIERCKGYGLEKRGVKLYQAYMAGFGKKKEERERGGKGNGNGKGKAAVVQEVTEVFWDGDV